MNSLFSEYYVIIQLKNYYGYTTALQEVNYIYYFYIGNLQSN